jgi:hypothetical protein
MDDEKRDGQQRQWKTASVVCTVLMLAIGPEQQAPVPRRNLAAKDKGHQQGD